MALNDRCPGGLDSPTAGGGGATWARSGKPPGVSLPRGDRTGREVSWWKRCPRLVVMAVWLPASLHCHFHSSFSRHQRAKATSWPSSSRMGPRPSRSRYGSSMTPRSARLPERRVDLQVSPREAGQASGSLPRLFRRQPRLGFPRAIAFPRTRPSGCSRGSSRWRRRACPRSLRGRGPSCGAWGS